MATRSITAILSTADTERASACLAIAMAAAALHGSATVYLHGAATALLVMPEIADARDQASAMGVRIVACQTGLADRAIAFDTLPAGVEAGGLVSLLAGLGEDRLVVI